MATGAGTKTENQSITRKREVIRLNYGSDPADQIVRFTLEGTEVALKLSGLAAKNFAMFVYAVLKDQKKARGKTRLVRMLREQRPFKFFKVPADRMKEFAKEAKEHGLLYVPIRKRKTNTIELVSFADDASKVGRILDNLNLDFVEAQAGEAVFANSKEEEKQAPEASVPSKTETVQIKDGAVEFEVGGFEDDFSVAPQKDDAENFTQGREKDSAKASAEKNPSEPFSPSRSSSPVLGGNERNPDQRPSVKKELEGIKQEQAEKKTEKSKRQERQHPIPGRPRSKKKKKTKGR